MLRRMSTIALRVGSLLAISLICIPDIYSQTEVSGELSGTINWTVSSSPYQVVGHTTIPIGNTLSIEPGVEVEFMGDYTLTVNGILEADGTSNDPITFSSDDGSRKGTVVLNVTSTTSLSSMSYCSFSDMLTGVDVNNDFTVSHSSFDNCSYGAQLDNGATLDGATITNCDYGVYGATTGNVLNSTIIGSGTATDNGGRGIQLSAYSYVIDGCTIVSLQNIWDTFS